MQPPKPHVEKADALAKALGNQIGKTYSIEEVSAEREFLFNSGENNTGNPEVEGALNSAGRADSDSFGDS